jgi:hypothetical protein
MYLTISGKFSPAKVIFQLIAFLIKMKRSNVTEIKTNCTGLDLMPEKEIFSSEKKIFHFV